MSSTRGRTSWRTKSSSAARRMDGGGGGAWVATEDQAQSPGEAPGKKEERMLVELWILWALLWAWAVVLRGRFTPFLGRTNA